MRCDEPKAERASARWRTGCPRSIPRSLLLAVCKRLREREFLKQMMSNASPAVASETPRGDSAPAPLAHEAIHDTVVEILEKERRGSLLDVPAAEGPVAARLIAAGF